MLLPRPLKATASNSPARSITWAGVGMAEAALPAPASRAYSDVGPAATCGFTVNTCHKAKKATPIASDRAAVCQNGTGLVIAALSHPPDLEALDVFLGLRGIEGFAHDHLLAVEIGRGAKLGHAGLGFRRQHDFLGDLLVVDVALDHVPALELRHEPDRHRIMRIGIEDDAVLDIEHVAEAVGVFARDHLLDDDFRLVEVFGLGEDRGDTRAVLRLRYENAGLDDGAVGREERVRKLLDPGRARREGAAGMALPEVARERVHVAGAFVDRALAAGLAAVEAVDVAGAQVRDVLGRWHDAKAHVIVGIDAVLGQEVAQHQRVLRLLERHAEAEALPVFWIAVVLMLHRHHQRRAVLVLDGEHVGQVRHRAGAHGHRDRHGHDLLRKIELTVQELVADDAGGAGLEELDRGQSVLLEQSHVLGHDQRRRAGDRDHADLHLGFLRRRPLLRQRLQGIDRQEAREGIEQHAGADRAQNVAPCHGIGEEAVQQRLFDAVGHDLLVKTPCIMHLLPFLL